MAEPSNRVAASKDPGNLAALPMGTREKPVGVIVAPAVAGQATVARCKSLSRRSQ